ncbi:MAG: hypothetical protein KGS00_13735 [Alphaproteobacteria bacterium]|nr:hypothetical protein [Alphaproteobacteria bacterium]
MSSAEAFHLLSTAFCASGAIAIFAALISRPEAEASADSRTDCETSSDSRQSIALLGLFALLDGFLLQFIATLETYRP